MYFCIYVFILCATNLTELSGKVGRALQLCSSGFNSGLHQEALDTSLHHPKLQFPFLQNGSSNLATFLPHSLPSQGRLGSGGRCLGLV